MKKKPTIVCVDDETFVLNALKEQLKRAESPIAFDLEIASSGEEALAIIKELMEDDIEVPLLISDQIMPGMKGDMLLKEVHQLLPNTLQILLTGLADAEAVGNAVNYGNLFRFVSKPWEEEHMQRCMVEALLKYDRERRAEAYEKNILRLNELLIASHADLKLVAEIFIKFVPNAILHSLGLDENDSNIQLGLKKERQMSVLFVDINDFTTLSEKMTVNETFDYINEFTAFMFLMANEYSGIIEKYIGDAAVILFESPDDAVKMAIMSQVKLKEFNKERQLKNLPPIHIGIGIDTGDVGIGLVGEKHRIEAAVIGSAMNTAEQLEILSKSTHSSILISEKTYELLGDKEKASFKIMENTSDLTIYSLINN